MFKKILFALCSLLFAFSVVSANAETNLSSSAFVNITSDTSSVAKKMAMDEARRQIIKYTVSKVIIDKDNFKILLDNAKDSDLTDLVSSVSIDNEKQSSTTYSANITMTLNNPIVKNWLDENNINNLLGAVNIDNANRKSVVVNLSNGLSDWIELNNVLSQNNLDFVVNKISNGSVDATISGTERGDFKSAVQNAGWKYSENSGVIKIQR